MSFAQQYFASTDASNLLPARLIQTAGASVIVDTGLTVRIQVETLPYVKYLDIFEPPEPKVESEDLISFSESEVAKLHRPDGSVLPLLSDIWRDNVNDDLVDP